jgi:hypothetical protein
MKKQVWYGVKDNRVHFFDAEPKGLGGLQGTGSFTSTGEIAGLNIEAVQQGAGGRQPERA